MIRTCLDCGMKDDNPHKVNYADIVYGVFLCERCAKLHRKLLPGPHRSTYPPSPKSPPSHCPRLRNCLSNPTFGPILPCVVLKIPPTNKQFLRNSEGWTSKDIIRLCHLGNLRNQQYHLRTAILSPLTTFYRMIVFNVG